MSFASARTRPERQSKRSQFIDAATLLALLFLTLFVTTFVLAEEETTDSAAAKPISQQDISAAEKRQYQVMKDEGLVDDTTVSTLVKDNAPRDDKYSVSWPLLGGTVGLAVLYLGFVYSTSFREYREVVAARFGREEEGEDV